METALLRMSDISKSFGATDALRSVSLEARPGEVLALIGENGAGKSTLMKVLAGAVTPDAGHMELAGHPYDPRDPHAARTAGVAMIYQELNLAPDLDAVENVMLGQELGRLGLVDRAGQRERVARALAQLGRDDLPLGVPVGLLSVADQQVVEIARALAIDAKAIVFDEPTSSLTQHDVDSLFRVIENLKRSGIAIIYISHFLEEIRRIADRYVVLRDGTVAGAGWLTGTSESDIVALMVGRRVDELFPTVPHAPGEVVLSLEMLSGRGMPRDVSLQLRRGEILGIAGLVGAGRTELLRCLLALEPVRAGTVRIAGMTVRATPHDRNRAGLGLVSEDRKGEGLAQRETITDNVTYSRLGPYSRWGWLNLRRRRAAVDEWMKRLNVKARSTEQLVEHLSGGNQQKVALARVMHQDADVLLLDEPTRGIDVATKSEIYRLMGSLAAEGKAIIFVSAYFTELLSVCDRVGVMVRGRLREDSAGRPVDVGGDADQRLGSGCERMSIGADKSSYLPMAQRGGDFLRTVIGPFVALALVVGVFALADHLQEDGGKFATLRNAQNVLVQSATVAVAALGMTMIIISGGIDLSAGTAMALSATVLAWVMLKGYPPAAAVAAGIATGCAAGLVNGTLVSRLRIVPFIVTLGTMTIYLGLAKILGNNTMVRPAPADVPAWMKSLLSPRVAHEWMVFSPGVWLLLILAVVVAAVLHYTVFGRHVFAIGSSEATARLCGINVVRTRITVYTIAGFFVGVAGLFQFSRLTVGDPTSGTGKELPIIAAVVIGGGSLNGGRGSILGTLTGALIMQVISSGCTALRQPNPIQEIIIGCIIIAAVTVDQFRQRRLAA